MSDVTTRAIKGPIALGGRTYRAGDEEALAKAADRHGVDLSDARFSVSLEGDWSTGSHGDALPEGFPGLKHLLAADVLTFADLHALGEEGIAAVPGIGKATVKAILKQLG